MFPELVQEVSSSVVVYTDGACSGNPGAGGWAAVILDGQTHKELSGFEPSTTNNRMELMAVIQALEHLAPHSHMTVYSDSEYVVKGVTQWLGRWKQNNWRTKSKNPVKNIDLWQRLDHAARCHTIAWKWVRGHAGDRYNELVDTLAVAALNACR